jgi:hypothetical protein
LLGFAIFSCWSLGSIPHWDLVFIVGDLNFSVFDFGDGDTGGEAVIEAHRRGDSGAGVD